MGLLDLSEGANRELQNEKLLPTVGFETFRMRREVTKPCAICMTYLFKMLSALYLIVLLKLTCTKYHVVDVVKCFVVYYRL